MLRLRKWQGAAVVLACCGLLAPRSTAFADAPQVPVAQTAQKAAPQKATDVALTKNGLLVGAAYMPNGKHLDGATVVITQNGKEVIRTNTTQDGSFAVAQLKMGSYQIGIGDKVAPIRVWNANIAPPKAKDKAILVTGEIVRGQDEYYEEEYYEYCPDGNCPPGGGPLLGLDVITLATVGAAATAAAVAIVNLNKLNDIEDCCNSLRSP